MKILERILAGMNQKLLQCASYLQQRSNQCSKRKLLVLLFLLCFVLITESTIVIIQSLEKKDTTFITVAPVRFIPLPGNKNTRTVFSRNVYERIQRFKNYLDSNQVFRDSLLALRPHLMDTLAYLLNNIKNGQ